MKEKRIETGEVFTPKEICNTLIGMSRYCRYNTNYKSIIKFCDTSCGVGNIIIRFLEDRINYCNTPDSLILLIEHIWGYDVLQENVDICRNNIISWLNRVLHIYEKMTNEKVMSYMDSITSIINSHIICADYLTTEVKNKFDLIIQNPPYIRGKYLEFLEKAYNDLNDEGEMVSIQPATWLINFHRKGKETTYKKLKRMFSHLTDRVIIENYNEEFGTGLYVPYSIIHIDNRNIEKFMHVTVCGEEFMCESLSDINMIDSTIGAREIIDSIIDKCLAVGDMMEDHIWNKKDIPENSYFLKFIKVIGRSFCGDPRTSDGWYKYDLLAPICFWSMADWRAGIKDTPHYQLKNGRTYHNPEYSNSLSDQLVGSKDDMMNFLINVQQCRIYPFLAIVFNNNMANQVYHYAPFFCYSIYLDDDIYKMLKLDDVEINMIEKTILKYNRQSDWYKRLQFGYNWKEHTK